MPIQSVPTPSECPRVSIGNLSDDLLLKIFCHYLVSSPRFWPRLLHVCRKWRRIVFASQRDLHIQLLCMHRTPALETIDRWPTLPIVVQYGGYPGLDPPAPEDEDIIVTLLKQSHRVSSISLTLTSSLLQKLLTITEPFPKLEKLVVLSGDHLRRGLPSAIQWGPHLRSLHLTRVTFPALSGRFGYFYLDLSLRNLVDLHLYDVPDVWYHPATWFVRILSRMSQLRSLSLCTTYHIDVIRRSPPSMRFISLPALTHLNFGGISWYLEDLVAEINAPRLRDIEITLLDELIFDIPNASEFIDRIEMQKSHRRAEILFSENAFSISFTQPGAPTHHKLKISLRPSSVQLSSMIEICNRYSAFHFGVEDLFIHATRLSKGQDNTGREKWAKLFYPFEGTKRFHVAGNLSTDIVLALQLSEKPRVTLLPALLKLCIGEPGPSYEPLREAVVSLMVSRRLSGRFIYVEYEIGGTGPPSQQVTIETLSDDVLLNIFRYYLDASPRSWPELAHVCQRWRQTVFTSTLGLDLRLYCTYGTSVSKTLECWPALPLVVNYGGSPILDPPAPEDEENIMVALNQPDRVYSITLTVTNSLLESLFTISEPFPELEVLILLSRDNVYLTLPNAFRWGTRLRTLHLTRIVIPALSQLLSHSTDLVDLQLYEIPGTWYISPEALTNALSGMTQLRILSLHFLSLPRRSYFTLPTLAGGNVVLPALTYLKYRGTSKYLDTLVARIDAPRLGDIDITFFNQPTLDASQLGQFIDRTEMLGLLSRTEIVSSQSAISIHFIQPEAPTRLGLRISCEPLNWQLSSMAQILDHFSPFLFRVQNLGISTTEPSSGQDDVGSEQWLELIRAFDGAEDFRVGGELATDILRALCPADGGHTTALPSLRNLHIQKPTSRQGPLRDSVKSFVTKRRLSSRPVQIFASESPYTCQVCGVGFTHLHFLVKHIKVKHPNRNMCHHCGVFEWPRGREYLFQEHLASEHPELTRTDALISNPA